MKIHKEGYGILTGSLIILAIINYLIAQLYPGNIISLMSLFLSGIIYILFLQFFRYPIREVVKNANHILAPADGKIVVIEKTKESEYLKDERIQISIFMSPVNVHANWSPMQGEVSYVKYHPGKYLVAWHPKASTENERSTIAVKNGEIEVLFRQIAGALARRIKYYVSEGQRIEQGESFGFIKFGSRVDVFLPTNAEIKVALDEKVIGQKTVLAVLKQ